MFYVLMAVMDVAPCSLVNRFQYFVGMFLASVSLWKNVLHIFLFVSLFVSILLQFFLLSLLPDIIISLYKFEVLQIEVPV